MKIKTLLLLALFLALSMVSIEVVYSAGYSYDCQCMGSCTEPFSILGSRAACEYECIESQDCCCQADCLDEGDYGCLSASCCDANHYCISNHCCPIGEIWNITTLSCQVPTLIPTCYELGGDSYCLANSPTKPECCGEAYAGTCQVCCRDGDCGFCQYCNKTNPTNYICSNQRYTDNKDECPESKWCFGGTCQCSDDPAPPGPPPCSGAVIEQDCVQYTFMGCDESGTCEPYESIPGLFLDYSSCCVSSAPNCVDVCVQEEGEGCGAPNNYNCCDGNVCVDNHCCLSGDIWNATGNRCEEVPLAPTCLEQANPDQYCATNFGAKDQCCGSTPYFGHCEECCYPEYIYQDCDECEYCTTAGGIGNFQCSNQPYGNDMKGDCPASKKCDGSGECVCYDTGDANINTNCNGPGGPIERNCVEYRLAWVCEYVGCGNCPIPCPMYPSNPESNPFSVTCCNTGGAPECVEACVLEEGPGPGGFGCEDYVSAKYPTGCCDPFHVCIDGHCCLEGATWDGVTETCLEPGSCTVPLSSCVEGSPATSDAECQACNADWKLSDCHCCPTGYIWDSNTVQCQAQCALEPVLSPSVTYYACAEEHSGGSVEYSGDCGRACYNYWIDGVKYSEACSPTQQCVEYESYYDYLLEEEGVKFCHNCVENLTECCYEGMAVFAPITEEDEQACIACGNAVGEEWYLDVCNCCPKGTEWDGVACRPHDTCYQAVSDPLYCDYMAPDSSFPQPEWWNTPFNPRCINTVLMQACCFVGESLFGQEPGDDNYYWHEYEGIITY
ncbi:hypothetical protein JXB28_00655 [Candidatus Woesearchaeota archaeon]|nr:hypothetical protein [Candidatus Woesearchaeota archaeon]